MDADIIVVGGGVVGAALAYGAAKKGHHVVVLDGDDNDLRAARANFGLVWVQGKGANIPAYSRLSLKSSDMWPAFHEELTAVADMHIDYGRPGGLIYCLGDDEYTARMDLNARIHNQNSRIRTEMIERHQLDRLLPAVTLGTEVVGASYCEQDGHVNPLQLLVALHRAVLSHGGKVLFRHPVQCIAPVGSGFEVQTLESRHQAPRVIVAAGLATPLLARPLGLAIPLRSERGQLLVTERVKPCLPFPGSGLRQTADGTLMIGATKEDTSDRGVTVASATKLALRATRIFPALAHARLVRQWSGFRVMPEDGAPIYAESTDYPGLFAAACHSGVTLAAAHTEIVASAMLEGLLAVDMGAFSSGRFDVQKCA